MQKLRSLKQLVPTLILVLMGSQASAVYKLVDQPRAIICSGPDNQQVTLSADRGSLTYEVEGETKGSQEARIEENNKVASVAVFSSSELTLTLTAQVDTMLLTGDTDGQTVNCRPARELEGN